MLALLVSWAPPATAQDARLAGSIRVGAEYDDNVFRREGDEREGGFLSRYFAALDLATRGDKKTVGTASFSHGGKFFFLGEHAPADTLLSQAALGGQHRLVPALTLWVNGDLRDRTERILKRDYTTGGIGGGVMSTLGPVSLRGGGAARYFAFKPNPDASSANIEGVASASIEVLRGLAFTLGYSVARRAFRVDRFDREGEDVVQVADDPRRDYFHTSRAGVGYRAKRIVAELEYALSINSSNSFGQGLRRHAVGVTATAPLPWRLFASAHVEIQRTTYDDPVRIDATFLVDEDNRNAGVLSLVRTFGENWELEARYSVYLQEFGVGSDYSRQTIFLAVAYGFE